MKILVDDIIAHTHRQMVHDIVQDVLKDHAQVGGAHVFVTKTHPRGWSVYLDGTADAALVYAIESALGKSGL